MGLADLTTEEFEKAKELLKLLGVFGITESDLRYLPEALKLVKESNMAITRKPTQEEITKIKSKYEQMQNAEQALKALRDEKIEEFYPDGRPE